MSVRVATWNIGEGLAFEERSPQIVESTKRLDADVVMLTDASWIGNELHEDASEGVVETALESFAEEGYRHHLVEYGQLPGHYPGRSMLALSRVGISTIDSFDGGLYRVARATVIDPDTERKLAIVGVHLDDQFEENRLRQVRSITSGIDLDETATVLVGNLNTMQSSSVRARALRSATVRGLAKLLQNQEPRNEYEEKHGRPNKVTRLVNMTGGWSMRALQRAGLEDGDQKHRPTTPATFPIAQLNYIMTNSFVEAKNFQVHENTGLSSHRAISADLYVEPYPLDDLDFDYTSQS